MDYFEEITDDEDFLELIEIAGNQRQRKPQFFQQRDNHFEKWTNKEFVKRFRLSKNGARFVLNRIQHLIDSPTERNHAVKPEEKLLLTLRFFATGSFLQAVGDFIGIHKSTASRIVYKVSESIASLYNEFIQMPSTLEELRHTSQQFYNLSRFPTCIGALDCTHVRILSPGGNEAEIYRNRKGFFSFNVQAVCSSKCMFQDVVCRWPGSTHDSLIFANSTLRMRLERGDFNEYVLLGDSGYGIKRYLITPLQNPIGRGETLFNESQIRTRNPIERTFGIWKRRFPNLAFGIRLKKDKVEAVVIATAVLHNIAIFLNDPVPPQNQEEEMAINFVNNVNIYEEHQRNIQNINNLRREQLINEYFAQL